VLAVPGVLAAQGVPNSQASDTAKSKVAAHRQNPQVPAQEASDIAKSKVAEHRATKIRGRCREPTTAGHARHSAVPATPSSGGSAGPTASPHTATPRRAGFTVPKAVEPLAARQVAVGCMQRDLKVA
jgi:hypothetical protein